MVHSVCLALSEIAQREYETQRQNSKRNFNGIGRRGLRLLEYAEWYYTKLLFCKEKRSENIIIVTLAYRTIVIIVIFEVVLCSYKKWNKIK